MPRNPFDYQPDYIACSIPCADPAVLKIRDMIRLEQAGNQVGGRSTYTLGMWLATLEAVKLKIAKLTVIEFGVFQGEGMLELCRLAAVFRAAMGIEFEIVGFDSGDMPSPVDHRDHPEIWGKSEFVADHDAIRDRLAHQPIPARLITGLVGDTIDAFVDTLTPAAPVGFVAVDLDYYSSTVDALRLFGSPNPEVYLPATICYFDDICDLLTYNRWCGEMAAINEFNDIHRLRKLDVLHLRADSPTNWASHMYAAHILDHPVRTGAKGCDAMHINITVL